jgi:aminoglycoside phosphotransferase family enzyme/predicted kinase
MQIPEFYPHSPPDVQFCQTHISCVFLAGERVYKVKKPVDFGFLDYSTARKRAYWCRRETELNRRLAPGVYLGVEKIYRRGGRFSLRPPGKVVDYAVVMKRLPEGRLLSSLMEKGRATVAQARRIARLVASFHAGAPPAAAANSRLGVLRKNLDENFRQTEPYIGRTVSRADYSVVYDYNRHFLRERPFLLRKRIAEGRIRDGHGDLHAEHICLTDPIVIYDCLEFSSRLRQTDVAAEIAFLYMDLLHHRHPNLARAFAEEYIGVTGDWEIRLLLSFYACYRAVVREKVESMRFADRHVPASQRREARRRATRYFHLARDLARRDWRSRLVAVGGLPGTGKSTLARLWAERLGAASLSSDAVRKELAGIRPGRRSPAGWREGIYTPLWTKRTYGEMMARAERLLRAGKSVVVDATFARRAERRLAAAAARRTGARYVTVECRCPEKLVRRRLAERKARESSLSDADWSIYRRAKGEYSSPRRETVRVDTAGDLEIALSKIAAAAFPL